MLEQAEHAAGEHRPGAVVAGGAQQPEPMKISASVSRSPSTSAWTSTLIRSSPGFCAPLGDHLHRLVPGAGHHLGHRLLARAQLLVAEPERHVGLLHVALVVLLRAAHEGADHPRDDRPGDVEHEVALAALGDAIEDPVDDRPDPLLVLGDPLRGEAALEQRLEPVVARRVHRDHLLLLAPRAGSRSRRGRGSRRPRRSRSASRG